MLSGKVLSAGPAWDAVKRRGADAELPPLLCNHSFCAAAITIHRENGQEARGRKEIAGHADERTTPLYVRKARKVAQAEIERVHL